MLQTRNVFIDTQCYVKAGLHFEGVAFEAFKELCEKGELALVITSIVEREVKNKIDDSIKEALQAVNVVQRKARILKSIDGNPIEGFFQPIDATSVHESAKKAFSDFLDDSNAKIAQLEGINIDGIFNDYFDGNAPFGDGKKKNEFPDAFSLAAVRNYVQGDGVYVISEDDDLKRFCASNPNCHQVDTLDKLLDIYNAHENSLSKAITSYILDNKESLNQEIEEIFNRSEAYNASTWDDSELESFSVLSISDLDPSVISIDGNSCIVTIDVAVQFEVTVTGPDFTNGYYDSEDKVVIPMDSTKNVDIEEKEFLIEIEMDFDINGDEITNVQHRINIDKLFRGIEFSVEENSYDYY
ncbi:hypothetical protein AC790_00400 [Pantoea sp. RIT-PI-b]|uniref:PIN domain-containing protein n=1 Tax=Pantoea sp. RIT-PI-b TaxID=1681195 RepID=UPI000676538B|nr:PIN domain-containing protein [Pantoea sp. RIT-PI-b]KNC17462.1 hypothetical protein AC790_00400 [Pantoea sp. RIT-PI-b]